MRKHDCFTFISNKKIALLQKKIKKIDFFSSFFWISCYFTTVSIFSNYKYQYGAYIHSFMWGQLGAEY